MTPAELQALRAAREKSAPPPPRPALDPTQLGQASTALAQLAGLLFAGLGAAYGDHWPLNDDQKTALGEAWAPILGPSMLERGGESVKYIAAFGISAAVVLPRVKATRERRKLQRAEPAQASADPEVPNRPGAFAPAADGFISSARAAGLA